MVLSSGEHPRQEEKPVDTKSLQLLKELMGIASPSGFEVNIQKVVTRTLKKYCADVRTDVHGNTIGVINPKAPLRVMLAGHCDEIGLMVTHIDDKGFVFVAAVGGIDPNVMNAQRVRFFTAKGIVPGVIGRKPIHLLEKEERDRALKIHELWVDIGAKDRKDAEKCLAVGDYGTIDAGFLELRNGLVAARGFDDRAGAFVVLETMRRLAGRKCKVGVYGVSSVQEEIGLRGARTSAFGIDPHVGIAVDVGFASDAPGMEPKITGECKLGKGPMLHRGPNINPVLGRMLETSARKRRIPFQITAEPRATGTDANPIQINREGSATALVSVPNRYMHTPVEVISLTDLDNASRLLTEFLADLPPDASFIPR